jgi:hypothetical protein
MVVGMADLGLPQEKMATRVIWMALWVMPQICGREGLLGGR